MGMEFLVIGDSKLKIVMNREDMEKYRINGDMSDYDDPKTRRSFWRILDAAREACGFEASGGKVLIQFYPSKDGGEVFVTKLGSISAGAEKTIAHSGRVTMLTVRPTVYKFKSFEALVLGAGIIRDAEYSASARAFFDGKDCYYITVEERTSSADKLSELSALCEFGQELPSSLAPYIAEHSREIAFGTLLQA